MQVRVCERASEEQFQLYFEINLRAFYVKYVFSVITHVIFCQRLQAEADIWPAVFLCLYLILRMRLHFVEFRVRGKHFVGRVQGYSCTVFCTIGQYDLRTWEKNEGQSHRSLYV